MTKELSDPVLLDDIVLCPASLRDFTHKNGATEVTDALMECYFRQGGPHPQPYFDVADELVKWGESADVVLGVALLKMSDAVRTQAVSSAALPAAVATAATFDSLFALLLSAQLQERNEGYVALSSAGFKTKKVVATFLMRAPDTLSNDRWGDDGIRMHLEWNCLHLIRDCLAPDLYRKLLSTVQNRSKASSVRLCNFDDCFTPDAVISKIACQHFRAAL